MRTAPKTSSLAALALVLTLALLPSTARADVTVSFAQPAAGTPLFGRVPVEVVVTGDEPVAEVEIHLDGQPVARRTEPPWVFVIDAGDDNREKTLEVIARSTTGNVARARLVAPAIVVHDRVEADLRQLYVTVTRRGKRVLDLPREAFRLTDDGRDQEIVTFETGDVPFTAVLLLDGSNSMRHGLYDSAVEGARTFFRDMRPLDQAQVMIFADRVLATSAVSFDPDVPLETLDGLRPSGGTDVFDPLYLGLRAVEGRQGRRVVILLSDGLSFHSVLGVEDVAEAARRFRAALYWVRLETERRQDPASIPPSAWSSPEDTERALDRLERIVRDTGGRVVSPRGGGAIRDAFVEILAELREQYVLGYYPDPPSDRDGGDERYRQVEVDVAGRGKVRARAGYVD